MRIGQEGVGGKGWSPGGLGHEYYLFGFGLERIGYQKTQEEFSPLAALLPPELTPYGRIMIDLHTLPNIFTFESR